MNKYIVFEIIKKGTPFAFQEILENKIAYKELSEKFGDEKIFQLVKDNFLFVEQNLKSANEFIHFNLSLEIGEFEFYNIEFLNAWINEYIENKIDAVSYNNFDKAYKINRELIQKFYDDCDAYSYSLDIDNKDDTNIQKYIFENVYKVLKELLNYNKYKEEVEIFCRIKTFESTDELTYLNSEILNYKLINDLQIIKRNNNFYAFNINDLKYIDYKDVWECQGYSSDENGNRISKENYSIEKFQKAKGSFNSNGNYSEEKIDYYKISL